MIDVKENGLLANKSTPGSKGGTVLYAGPILTYDSRNQLFFSTDGSRVQLAIMYNSELWSPYKFWKWQLDYTSYVALQNHVLAFNLGWEQNVGNVPFNEMAMLGGTKRLRGVYLGRFRDKLATYVQSEYRSPTYKRFGAVAFVGIGQVAPELKKMTIQNPVVTYGGGLRFVLDTKNQLNVRFDYGQSNESSGFYLTVGEAF